MLNLGLALVAAGAIVSLVALVFLAVMGRVFKNPIAMIDRESGQSSGRHNSAKIVLAVGVLMTSAGFILIIFAP